MEEKKQIVLATYPSEAKDEFLDMDLGDMSSSR